VNVGIEATKAHHKDGGFGRYPRKLIKNILQLDESNQYIVFTSEIIEDFNEFDNCHQVLVPSSDGIGNLRLYYTFRKIIRKYKIDVLHLLSLYGIRKAEAITVSTVFDLRYLVIPELNERKLGRVIYKYWFPHLLRQSHHLIAISEETNICLTKKFNIPREKITTIPLGHEIEFKTETNLKWNDLPGKYFLWVGQITKRKNLETLYNAYSLFVKNPSNYDVKLIIVGSFLNSEIEEGHKRIVNRLGINNMVMFTGYVPDNKLSFLYKRAMAFIFPSIYEGFGIPIIESMALGVPVITTIDGGATKEVAGDAALFFSRYNHDVLSTKMVEIVKNEKLRNQLIIKGRERAAIYTWEKTARQTLNLYRKLVGSKK